MHFGAWLRGELSQREYCEVHGLSRKSFSTWRAIIKYEDAVLERRALNRQRRQWRPSPGFSPMTNPMTESTPSPPLVVPKSGRRRNFAETVKRRIVEHTCQPGMSVSAVARRYGIAVSVLFRWRRDLGLTPKAAEATLLPVKLTDAGEAASPAPLASSEPSLAPPAIVVERPVAGIEIELIGGRRVRIDRDVDPETVRRLVLALEGSAP
jgi:transposase